jgi:GTP:adenosylcobinamide-phosphate guanylyltransferase
LSSIATANTSQGYLCSGRDDVATVLFAEGAVDVDTPQDYEILETIVREEKKRTHSRCGP